MNSPGPADPSAPAAAPRGKRILLVDDNPRVREAFKLLLRLDGHRVTEAENGNTACLMYTPGDFDLVITDYAMPEMMGDELARTLKCLVPTQPLLMVTGQTEPARNPDNPVDAILRKPFTLAELRRAMADLLSPDDSSPPAPCPDPLSARQPFAG